MADGTATVVCNLSWYFLQFKLALGAHWPVPDYSTGTKFLGDGEWKRKKHRPEYRRQWRKMHLVIDAQTLEIRAIEVTDNSVGDGPMLPCLLEQIAEQENSLSVSADGVYDTKACREAICQRHSTVSDPRLQGGRVTLYRRLKATA